MKKYIQTSIVIVYIISYLPVLAEQIRQLSWEDLIPEHQAFENSIAHLTQEQQDLFYWVTNMLENLPKKRKKEADDSLYEKIDKAILQLKKAGIDIDKVMAKRKETRTSIVEDLNGRRVRIPGYLLPLEVSGSKVTEFLLVPYVGACIHAPPPPPNQIVHVKVTKRKGYNSKESFETVWVTGVISAKSMVKNLYLVDGSADINIGYAMKASRIEPYK